MAGNEWINGYLEAILDAGARKFAGGSNTVRNTADVVPLVPSLRFSPTRYFVEEVINSFDEADLYKTWVKVVAMRNTKERNNRLENMCWRIWNLARKKKQIELEDARGLVKRRKEREQGRNDAADDISELSEGEKTGNGDSEKQKMSRINSDIQFWPDEEDGTNTRLYIVLISLHGLVRGENMELGRDSDTGGQVKYVVELARALAAMKGVHRVDLLTRQISDPDVDWSYGEPVEMLTRPSDLTGDGCGAYIIRIPCGPREKYVAKESLWPYIPEFIDRALAHVIDVGRALGDQNEGGGPVWPYVIHGHYADAGEVAARLAGALNVPMVLTGHSLGRNKFEQLLKQGRLSREDINSTYKIMRRIEAEELGLDAAEMVVTSTRQEIEEQWGLYDGFDPKLERKLRVRRRRGVSCLGRHMPRMVVIPPGMDFSYVNSQENLDGDVDLKALIGPDRTPKAWKKIPPIWSEVMRFFTNPHKPMILALSRPDPKKNVTTLIKAFGESQHLRELANMTLILGNRDDVEEMSGGGGMVLTAVLKLIDKYDLYGQVAYPKHHKQSEVPEIYRLAAKTKGVFINPALVEPFGLTLIEAAAYGLPVVATKNGGPVDILKALNNGLLIDPHDHKAISEALLKLVADKNLWQDCRKNGLKNIHRFSWPEHCKNYLSHVQHCRSRHPTTRLLAPARVQEEPMSDSLKEVEDLSIRFSVDVTTAGGDGKSIPGGGAGDVTASLLDALRMHHRQRATNGVKIGYSAGRRERLLVIAVDCYDAGGRISTGQLGAIVNRLMGVSGKSGGATGLVLSSGSTLQELVEALKECGAAATDFDALICNGGGEIYFPSTNMEADIDYAAHVEYRWPAEYVKLSVPKLAKMDSETAAAEAEADVLVVEEAACGHNSYAYSLKAGAEARKVDDMKQRLRMRGFRCNLIYTRAGTRLVILPLFASRAHALRYLWIRWGVELSKMVVFVGEKGDTDHENLLLGLHKAVILNGIVNVGSESLLRGEESYKRDDVVDQHSPNVAYVDDAFGEDEISNALQRLGFKC